MPEPGRVLRQPGMSGNAKLSFRDSARSWGAPAIACCLGVSLCFNVALGWEVQATIADRHAGIGHLAVDSLPSLRLLSRTGEPVAIFPDRERPTIMVVPGPAWPTCSFLPATASSTPHARDSYRTVVVVQGVGAASLRRWLASCATPSFVYRLESGTQFVSTTPAVVILGSDGKVKAVFTGRMAARPWSDIVASALAGAGRRGP
jgi:hypothetical protein